MQTQKDHVQAYQFMVDRMSAALVYSDCAVLDVPCRRAKLGLLIGSVLTVLVVLGFFVYGLIVPGGNTAWSQPGAILVEEETGTRYVLIDGALRPTRNQASALLIQGTGAAVHTISRASLDGLPHGAPVGIPDAPDPLPTAAAMVTGPTLVCARGRGMTLVPAWETSSQPVPADRFLFVRTGDTAHLVLDGEVLRLDSPAVLGLTTSTAPEVSPAWLALLPRGPVVGPARIPDRGEPGPEVDGRNYPVGQLFEQRVGDRTQRFVLRADGLAPLTQLEFALLAADGADTALISAAAVQSAPRSADASLLRRLPDLLGLEPEDRSPCVPIGPDGTAAGPPVLADPEAGTGGDVAVALAPGQGMLLVDAGVPERDRNRHRYLVTDQGTRFHVPDDRSLRALGLGGVAATPMPTAVLDRIRSGPTLSQAAVGLARKG